MRQLHPLEVLFFARAELRVIDDLFARVKRIPARDAPQAEWDEFDDFFAVFSDMYDEYLRRQQILQLEIIQAEAALFTDSRQKVLEAEFERDFKRQQSKPRKDAYGSKLHYELACARFNHVFFDNDSKPHRVNSNWSAVNIAEYVLQIWRSSDPAKLGKKEAHSFRNANDYWIDKNPDAVNKIKAETVVEGQ